jgi:hypothetical protein
MGTHQAAGIPAIAPSRIQRNRASSPFGFDTSARRELSHPGALPGTGRTDPSYDDQQERTNDYSDSGPRGIVRPVFRELDSSSSFADFIHVPSLAFRCTFLP